MLSINKYNRWLRGLVDDRRSSPSYDILFDMAFVIRYEYSVPNDHNRAEDGLKLRERFEYETSIKLPDLGECRILEFLIALAIRLNESVYDNRNPNREPEWFWTLINNLELDEYNDEYNFHRIHTGIESIFRCLNNRLYNADGTGGGVFPLENPKENQQDVEVWYQMMAYLQEGV